MLQLQTISIGNMRYLCSTRFYACFVHEQPIAPFEEIPGVHRVLLFETSCHKTHEDADDEANKKCDEREPLVADAKHPVHHRAAAQKRNHSPVMFYVQLLLVNISYNLNLLCFMKVLAPKRRTLVFQDDQITWCSELADSCR